VVDAAGRIWHEGRSQQGPEAISLSGWPAGTYFITFETARGVTALPFIKH
jgi:hypothetical protein